ncbi:hypothetical protein TrVFT333_002521 [Trichoderma virens FT-333]|nr:hypothetical protein TrVFT333_002521 [Trichoderma virens FT-333]
MVNKAIIASLLIGAAMAVPYPPSATDGARQPAPKHAFPHKKVNGGNYQPSRTSKSTSSKTSAAPAVAKDQDNTKRATGETVNNSVARYDNSNITDGVGDGVDSYTLYLGDGSTGAGWPDQSRWVSFENMFNNYKNIMFSSCENIAGQANDSGPEVGAIWDGIQSAAAATGVDHRFILAVIMQESGGCVRVQTTNYGVRNPGLMQDHNGGYVQ